jgi:uncharacterized protein (DUF58 family)
MNTRSHRLPGLRRFLPRLALIILGFLAATAATRAATTMDVSTSPKDGSVDIGDALTLTIKLTGSRIAGTIRLPNIDGLTYDGSSMSYDNTTETFHFFLTPTRNGDFVVPGFDIKTQSGEKFHVADVKIHAPRRG